MKGTRSGYSDENKLVAKSSPIDSSKSITCSLQMYLPYGLVVRISSFQPGFDSRCGKDCLIFVSATSRWKFIGFTLWCSKVISTYSQPWHVRRETEIPCKAPSIYFEKRTLLLGSSSLITSAAGGHGNLRFFSVLQFFFNIG